MCPFTLAESMPNPRVCVGQHEVGNRQSGLPDIFLSEWVVGLGIPAGSSARLGGRKMTLDRGDTLAFSVEAEKHE